MTYPRLTTVSRRLLIILLYFGTVSALGGDVLVNVPSPAAAVAPHDKAQIRT